MSLKSSDKQKLTEKYGQWAIVTGASSGIGKAFAEQLAEAGLNVVLSARRKKLLQDLAADLQSRYGIETKIVEGDLTDAQTVENLLRETENLNVGLAVMNAGFGTSGDFLQSNLDDELEMLDLNCKTLFVLTHHFSKRFAGQKRGGIILLSSIVAFQGVPFAAHYAATKAYVQTLGEAISLEVKPFGVDILVAAPGPVKSGFGDRADMDLGNAINPDTIIPEILSALGKKSIVFPGRLTKILLWSLRTVPRWGKIRIMKMVMGGMTKHQRN